MSDTPPETPPAGTPQQTSEQPHSPASTTSEPHAHTTPHDVTRQIADMATIVRTNMTLMHQQLEQSAELQTARWAQAEAVLTKVEAILELLEQFLAGVDEQTERLVTVSAALIRYQQQQAATHASQG